MQKPELLPERLFINRPHALEASGFLPHRPALGRSRRAIIAIKARAATDKFKVSGLNAAVRYSGALIATTGIPTIMSATVSQSGQLRRHRTSNKRAKATSTNPARVAAVCSLSGGAI